MNIRPLLALALIATACGGSGDDGDLAGRLAAAEAEVASYAAAQKTLEADLATVRQENRELAAQLDDRTAAAADCPEQPVREEVTRVVEAPDAREPEPAPAYESGRVSNGKGIEVVTVGARVTERNTAAWWWGYSLVLANETDTEQTVAVELQFMDGDGYAVATVTEHRILVRPGAHTTVTGRYPIDLDVAPRVASVRPVFQ